MNEMKYFLLVWLRGLYVLLKEGIDPDAFAINYADTDLISGIIPLVPANVRNDEIILIGQMMSLLVENNDLKVLNGIPFPAHAVLKIDAMKIPNFKLCDCAISGRAVRRFRPVFTKCKIPPEALSVVDYAPDMTYDERGMLMKVNRGEMSKLYNLNNLK
jgi:hypothetical protein